MRICYINPTNNIRRPIAELANLLTEQVHAITIVYPYSPSCPTDNWVPSQMINNPKIKKIPITSWYFSPLRYSFPNIFQLRKAAKANFRENDIVHIWEYYYPISVLPLFFSLFNTKYRQKVILTTDGFVGYSYRPKQPRWLVPAFRLYTQMVARLLYKIPSQITTYGKSMLPHAQKAGVPRQKLKIISTGIHLAKFQQVNPQNVENLKKEFAIQKQKIILYAGMLTERKGINKVIAISEKLLQEGRNIKTLLVGDAHGENIYNAKVNPQWKDMIIFTGGRKDIPDLMHLADVLLLPSEGEGLPGVVMEAMAAGLPVVASDEGCTPDLIENGREGFLVNIGDVDGYYQAVRKILNDGKLAEQFSRNSQKKIQQFSWDNVSDNYLRLYQEISG